MSLIRGAAGPMRQQGHDAPRGLFRDAALVDPDIEALWGRIQTECHANQRVIVERLAARKALRRGLGLARATDILWTITYPTSGCCWSVSEVGRRCST